MDFKRNRGELGTEGNHLSPTELKDGGGGRGTIELDCKLTSNKRG